jgi:uncharacterized protein
MDLGELTTGNLLRVIPSFNFRIIVDDPDDNKFVDCAIASEADYVLTEDLHFSVLRNAGFRPQPMQPAEFIARFLPRL